MRHEILDRPDFSLLKIFFEQPGETFVSEAGAMVSMSHDLQMTTSMRGGLLSAAKRKLLGGETLFQNTYTCTTAGQEAFFAPGPEGDLSVRNLQGGEEFYLSSGAYVGHTGESLQLDTKWGGVKGFFSGVGLFLVKITGPGTIYYYGYGAIREVPVGPEGYRLDTGHIVGFTQGLSYQIEKFGGYKGLFFSGEGLIANFQGQGTLFMQTRNAGNLASFLEPFRRVESSD